ncbi:hypothetical protein Tsubulata_044880 [Turnera subulata]|uniref:Carbonic anhydrase n=1 Tax=Turnera subulata TaxID=218843 RepID=A0A9Q0G5W6_9ROSI|nr:hypothetical protein Tsubulata_044880 [Turnera subulata]
MEGSEKGPAYWGDLKEEWAACKSGGLQSPIDMSSQRVKVIRNPGKLKKNYKPGNATIKNRGHDIMVKWEENKAGSMKMNGTEYFLQQSHWHSPSEHTINGRRYDLELHMVHASHEPDVENKILVIAVLYKIGKPDAFLSKFVRDMVSIADSDTERPVGCIDPSEIIETNGRKYYRYMGSLTTPPCSEGVIWTIKKKIRTVSRNQIRALREAVHDYAEKNARPKQAHNRREIHLYNPNPDTSNEGL